MRITIEHKEETKGLLFKKPSYAVRLTIVFSEEELAIIKHRKLKDYPLYSYDMFEDGEIVGLPIGLFMDGRPAVRSFDNLVNAKAFEAELKEKHLPALRSLLDASRETGKTDTFEL